MAETFYSVLGVDPDADTETIKAAYREKVKTHHPDVSDEENAREAFKRITDARDVLVDETSRSQYDRIGHETYVRRYLDSNAWSVEDAEATASSRRTSSSAGGSQRSGSSGRRGSRTRSRTTDTDNAEDYDRYRSNYSEQHRRDGNPFGDRRRRDRAWTEPEDEEWWSTADTDIDETAEASGTTTGADRDRNRSHSDQWDTAQTASNVYKTGTRSDVKPSHTTGGIIDIVREIGPWLAFHFVFLVSAFVTIWLFMTWTASRSSFTVPALFVSMLLLGFSVFFSILHMISRLYS